MLFPFFFLILYALHFKKNAQKLVGLMSFFLPSDIEFGTFYNRLRLFLYTFPILFRGIILLSVPNFPLSAYYHNFNMIFQCIQVDNFIFLSHFNNLTYSLVRHKIHSIKQHQNSCKIGHRST